MLKIEFLWDMMLCCWMSDPDVSKGLLSPSSSREAEGTIILQNVWLMN
jgi:hypothetical protein